MSVLVLERKAEEGEEAEEEEEEEEFDSARMRDRTSGLFVQISSKGYDAAVLRSSSPSRSFPVKWKEWVKRGGERRKEYI